MQESNLHSTINSRSYSTIVLTILIKSLRLLESFVLCTQISKTLWSVRVDSNHRHSVSKTDRLPTAPRTDFKSVPKQETEMAH